MSRFVPDNEFWFWCASECRNVRAWIVCNHVLSGAPIRAPGPPTVANDWTGSLYCAARAPAAHELSEAKLMCEYCAAADVPEFATWLRERGRGGWHRTTTPGTIGAGGNTP